MLQGCGGGSSCPDSRSILLLSGTAAGRVDQQAGGDVAGARERREARPDAAGPGSANRRRRGGPGGSDPHPPPGAPRTRYGVRGLRRRRAGAGADRGRGTIGGAGRQEGWIGGRGRCRAERPGWVTARRLSVAGAGVLGIGCSLWKGHWPRAGVNGAGWEGWSLKKE